jgi:hypothetical protein
VCAFVGMFVCAQVVPAIAFQVGYKNSGAVFVDVAKTGVSTALASVAAALGDKIATNTEKMKSAVKKSPLPTGSLAKLSVRHQ